MELRDLRDIENVADAGEVVADAIWTAYEEQDYTKLAYLLGRIDQRGTSYIFDADKTVRALIAQVFGLAPVPRSAADFEPPEPAEIAAELGIEAE
jgi:hypothetical protein